MAINPVQGNSTASTTDRPSLETGGPSLSSFTGNNTFEILQNLEAAFRASQLLNGGDHSRSLSGSIGSRILNGEPAPSDSRLRTLFEAATITERYGREMDTFAGASVAEYSQSLPGFTDLASDKEQFESYLAKAQEALTVANKELESILPDSPIRAQAEGYIQRIEAVIERITAAQASTYAAALTSLDQLAASAVEYREDRSFLVPVNGRVVIQGDDGRQDLHFRTDGQLVYFDRDGQRFYIDTEVAKDIVINLKGGDDRVRAYNVDLPGVNFLINGGAGADTLQGSRGADWIIGGAGRDAIYTEGVHGTAAAEETEEGEETEPGEVDFVDANDGGIDDVFNGGSYGYGRLAGATEVFADAGDRVNEPISNNHYHRDDANLRRPDTRVNGVQQEEIAPPPRNNNRRRELTLRLNEQGNDD